MATSRPPKLKNVEKTVARHLAERKIRFSLHARKRLNERDITRFEAMEILETGRREPGKDEFKDTYRAWTYAYRGKTSHERRNLRIAVAIASDNTIVVTTIVLDSEE